MYGRELFYIGTFSDLFYTVALDRETESLTLLNETYAPCCPDVFAISADKHRLYIGIENYGGRGGLCTFDISNPLQPKMFSNIVSESEGPCYMALISDKERAYLVTSGYFDGRLEAYLLNDSGDILQMSDELQVYSSGPYRNQNYISQQDHARLHCAVPVPNTPYFVTADLGGDFVYVYRLDKGEIREINRKKLRSASGPRHIACAASGKTLYLVDELDCLVSVLDFDPEHGDIQVRQRISALPDCYTEDSWCSAIHLSSDGRFLYIGNRGHDSIAIFTVEEDGKRLTQAGWFKDGISEPREFQFDQSGAYLLAGGMKTNCLTLNRVDLQDGSLKRISTLSGINQPACIISAGMM